MDLDYLLLLQDFRNAIQDALTPLMEWLSSFAVGYLCVTFALLYWCFDKRIGLYALASWTTAVAVNSVVKLTACVYRPWIRDSRIVPAGDSITSATGYSFPSGHSVSSSSIYGSYTVSAWKKYRWISVLSLAMMILTGFSRNYLGVHTPQDVAVGLTEGMAVAVGLAFLFRYLEQHPEKELYFLIGGIIFVVLALLYITFKSYPMDYNADGKLIVDPDKMMNDGYGDLAKLFTFCICRFVDTRWIRFQPVLNKFNAFVGMIGMVILMALDDLIKDPLIALLGGHWGKFTRSVVIISFIMVIWPLVMKALQKKEQKTAPAA